MQLTQSQKDVLYILVQDKMELYEPETEQYIQLERISHMLRPINWVVTVQLRDKTPKTFTVEAESEEQAINIAKNAYNSHVTCSNLEYVPHYLLHAIDVHKLSEDMPQ